MRSKNVYIIAGANGSGKTTFAKTFLPEYAQCPNFINADLIAQGLAPFNQRSAALKAGKLVLFQIDEFSHRGIDFAFETTLSGKAYAALLKILKNKGYKINLFFLWIPNPEMAIGRIKDRVKDGGHYVPDVDVRRRFNRGVDNFFKIYEPILDSWMLFDNSRQEPVLIAKRNNGNKIIVNQELFDLVCKDVR
jgi:predicted ABC-type ATPase